MSDIYQMSAIITNISTKVDGSIKLVIETPELQADKVAILFGLRNKECEVALSPHAITEADLVIPESRPDPLLKSKTPSQRMRNVIFILWKEKGQQGDFDSYYNMTMERIIEQLKDRIA